MDRFYRAAMMTFCGLILIGAGWMAHMPPAPCQSVANVASWSEVHWHSRNLAWDLSPAHYQPAWAASEAVVVTCDLHTLGFTR
jgi:hypothetical protein